MLDSKYRLPGSVLLQERTTRMLSWKDLGSFANHDGETLITVLSLKRKVATSILNVTEI